MTNAQVSLVAYYRSKPDKLSQFLTQLIDRLSERLNYSFQPYQLEQIHATIIGCEHKKLQKHYFNSNFLDVGHQREMDFNQAIQFLDTSPVLPFNVQIGGYEKEQNYGFSSFGKSPWERSFSIQGKNLVLIGWPKIGNVDGVGSEMAYLRREMETYGILHKWHRNTIENDNDLYFMIGHLSRELSSSLQNSVVDDAREYLANTLCQDVELSKRYMGFVRYEDTCLPVHTTRYLPLKQAIKNPEKLASFIKEY